MGVNMPMCVCTHRHNQACTYMHTEAQSGPHVYAHIGMIVPARICTYGHDRACTYMCTKAQSGLDIICTHMRDHTCTYMHTKAQSCLHVYAHIGTILLVHNLDIFDLYVLFMATPTLNMRKHICFMTLPACFHTYCPNLVA
jgi:hypothetical protein